MRFASVSCIGCGNMGSAFMRSIARAFPDVSRCAFDTDTEKLKAMDASPCRDEQDAASRGDIIILAVKPQVLSQVCVKLTSLENRRYVSLAPGFTTAQLSAMLGTRDVVRFMPTIAAAVSASPVAVCWDEADPPDWSGDALELAGCAGTAMHIPESLMASFIGVSGSGIAYVLQFIHALALGGVQAGLPYRRAVELASATLSGAAALLEETGAHPAELVTQVTSPGGTTIEGIHALEEGGFTASVMNAVTRSARKSETFSKPPGDTAP